MTRRQKAALLARHSLAWVDVPACDASPLWGGQGEHPAFLYLEDTTTGAIRVSRRFGPTWADSGAWTHGQDHTRRRFDSPFACVEWFYERQSATPAEEE